jgi:hypothetical protein
MSGATTIEAKIVLKATSFVSVANPSRVSHESPESERRHLRGAY